MANDSATALVLHEHWSRHREELTALGMAPDHDPERVFTNEHGETVDESNPAKTWHRLEDKTGIPRALLHDARHMRLTRFIGRALTSELFPTARATTMRSWPFGSTSMPSTRSVAEQLFHWMTC